MIFFPLISTVKKTYLLLITSEGFFIFCGITLNRKKRLSTLSNELCGKLSRRLSAVVEIGDNSQIAMQA
jgi:hypothetical protein